MVDNTTNKPYMEKKITKKSNDFQKTRENKKSKMDKKEKKLSNSADMKTDKTLKRPISKRRTAPQDQTYGHPRFPFPPPYPYPPPPPEPAAGVGAQTYRTPPKYPYPDTNAYPPPLYPYPPYPTYPVPYYTKPTIIKKRSEIPIFIIFLVCITVFWLPYFVSAFIGSIFYGINTDLAELIAGIALCILTIPLMFFLRQNLDKPNLRDYGLSTDNLGNNLLLAVKLIFIIYASEFLVVTVAQFFGVPFEGGVQRIDILFIISAVIVAPIFEETVYRMNASTLLARRLPIIWVSCITSFWFIAKHIPMWHFENNFGLAAILIIVAIDIPLWTIVTYYFLKRKCIWIPIFVHVFNNGSIALFYYLPDAVGMILDYSFVIIGIVFIFVFGIPKLNEAMNATIKSKKFKLSTKFYNHMLIAIGLAIGLLLTSEALVSLDKLDQLTTLPIGTMLCFTVGLMLFILSIITIIYIISNRNIIYVDE